MQCKIGTRMQGRNGKINQKVTEITALKRTQIGPIPLAIRSDQGKMLGNGRPEGNAISLSAPSASVENPENRIRRRPRQIPAFQRIRPDRRGIPSK